MNFVTGEISVVMTNMDPGVDQTESGKSIRDRDTDTGSWKKLFAGLKSMKV